MNTSPSGDLQDQLDKSKASNPHLSKALRVLETASAITKAKEL